MEAATGPLVILAGAGSGKTRVISRRAAYAIATGAVSLSAVLLVTFTDKAAREMEERMAALGFPGVMARTFHAMARAQLAWFWPSQHDGQPFPELLPSKARIVSTIVRGLPGHYRFTPSKDVAEVIEWAKVRRIEPRRWVAEGGDRAPIPPDLFARVYAEYERTKQRAGMLDFEDLLVETVRLLEEDAEAAEIVRQRKRWFSVDEYQDTSPLADRLVSLWLGDSRDICVVGDPDQTIYLFTGASPDYLLEFDRRYAHARVVRLLSNYRSTPSILAFANRLTAGGPRGDLVAVRPDGARPVVRRHPDADAELAAIVDEVRTLLSGGRSASDMAVLVRTNAQIPLLEEAFTRAGLPYRASVRFFARPDVREARRMVARLAPDLAGPAFVVRLREAFTEQLGLGDESGGPEARERDASLGVLIEIAQELVHSEPATGPRALVAELDRRAAAESAVQGEGVELLTYHRAKGLEWSVVLLPAVEEGLLPIRQAKEADAIAEERRLLYVGITRARDRLVISWAAIRDQAGNGGTKRRPSRFLAALAPATAQHTASTHQPTAAQQGGTNRVRLPEATSRQSIPRKADLLPDLLTWRSLKAARDHVTPAAIVSDSTLEAVAEARPGSLAALRRVPGMGPERVELHGPAILAVVASAGTAPKSADGGHGSDSTNADLVERLRTWRRDRSRAEGVPAYVLAPDATLDAIAEARPTSPASLLKVHGMGPARMEKYGHDILAIVNGEDPPSSAASDDEGPERSASIRPAVLNDARLRSDAAAPERLDDDDLFDELRRWRLDRAATEGIAPFMVLWDRTLLAIVEARPRTLDALLGVHGMGPAKVERYGEEIVSVVRRS